MPTLPPLPEHQGRRHPCRRCPFPWALLRSLLAPWEALSFHQSCRGPPVPCHIPQLPLSTRSFRHIDLKGSSKLYLCKQCKKQTSNWDSMVSYCLSGASWDPSGLSPVSDELFGSLKVGSTAGGSIICCFIRLFKIYISVFLLQILKSPYINLI